MPDIRIEQAARLATDWGKFGPFEVRVITEAILKPPWASGTPGKSMKTLEMRYIETPARQRFFDTVMKNDVGKVFYHTTDFADGQRFAVVEYQEDDPDVQNQVRVGVSSFANEASSGGSGRPYPIKVYFVHKVPLHEALPTSTFLGNREYLGKNCHLFLFKDVLMGQMRQELVYYVADDCMLPLRFVSYIDADARNADRPFWYWETLALKDVDGRPFPMKSREVHMDQKDPSRQSSIHVMTVEKVESGGSYPASMFWPRAEPGATLMDFATGKVTLPPANPSTGTPIRVGEEADYTGYLSFAGLAIGFAVLVTAAILRYRRS